MQTSLLKARHLKTEKIGSNKKCLKRQQQAPLIYEVKSFTQVITSMIIIFTCITILCKNPAMNHNLPVLGTVQVQNKRNVCCPVNSRFRPERELHIARPKCMSHLLPSPCTHPFSATSLSTRSYLAARYPFYTC